jgi:hypothetical protein
VRPGRLPRRGAAPQRTSGDEWPCR